MIESNELRIGNWITANLRGTGRVLQIGEFHITIEQGGVFKIPMDFSEIQPIPLTPEMLEASGFQDGEIYIEEQSISLFDGDFLLGGFDAVTSGQCFRVQIKFLHQLQNLYFALTGQELKVNIPQSD